MRAHEQYKNECDHICCCLRSLVEDNTCDMISMHNNDHVYTQVDVFIRVFVTIQAWAINVSNYSKCILRSLATLSSVG